jgi:hypothetical protein
MLKMAVEIARNGSNVHLRQEGADVVHCNFIGFRELMRGI